MTPHDRYSGDVLAEFAAQHKPAPPRPVMLQRGLVIEHTTSEWCGAVVGIKQGGLVELEDFQGRVRAFSIADGFLIDGKPVSLALPKRAGEPSKRTASGSVAVTQERARVAMPSRIFVEGRHDAELVEHVWGDDLRVEGVVVELLEGADHLEEVLDDFAPNRRQRAGVLLDHLVTGSKETKIAARVAQKHPAGLLIVGHPYVDVWQAVKPGRLGLSVWPKIPRNVEWKRGVCAALGWPHSEQADIAEAWRRILGRVRDWSDLEPAFIGRVEELIDFVTVEA